MMKFRYVRMAANKKNQNGQMTVGYLKRVSEAVQFL